MSLANHAAWPLVMIGAAAIAIIGDLTGLAATVQLIALVALLAIAAFWIVWQAIPTLRDSIVAAFPEWGERGPPLVESLMAGVVAILLLGFALLSEAFEASGGVIATAWNPSLIVATGPAETADADPVPARPVTTVRIEPEPEDQILRPGQGEDDRTPAPTGPLSIDEMVVVSERQIRPVIINLSPTAYDMVTLLVSAVRAGEESVVLSLTERRIDPAGILTPLVLIEDIGDGYLVCIVGRNVESGQWIRAVRRFGPVAATVNDRLAPDGLGVSEDVDPDAAC